MNPRTSKKRNQHHHGQNRKRHIIILRRRQSPAQQNAQRASQRLERPHNAHIQIVMPRLHAQQMRVQHQYQIQTADAHSFQNVRTAQCPEIIGVVHQNGNGNHAQQ